MVTPYFLNLIMGNVFKTKTNPEIPENVYLGLSSSAPSEDGTNVNEPPESAGYERVKLTDLSEPDNGVITNTAPIEFPESLASWNNVRHFVLYDAPSGGNLLMYNSLAEFRSVEASTIVMIKTGKLKLTLKNPS